jgi:Flp pilus assembly protein TadG
MVHGSDAGSAAIEAAVGTPAFMLFVLLIIFGGRVAIAHQAVQSAASEAARTASIARTQGEAQTAGESGASASLSSQGLHCVSRRVSVDASGFALPVGTPARIQATVDCTIDLSDVAAPGVPGSMTITESMTSPLDTYRER